MSSVGEVAEQADKERIAGNYRGALELVRPFLLAREKMSPLQERAVVRVASGCYRCLCRSRSVVWFWNNSWPPRVNCGTPRR